MSETIRKRLVHALLAMLLSAGLLMPLLGILQPSFLSPSVLIGVAAVVLLFELAAINRTTALIGAGVSIAALLVWLFAFGGLLRVSDAVLAIALRAYGIRTALPLAAQTAVPLIVIVVTLLSCLSCLKGASVLPASILCFCMILLIYLSDASAMIPWFLPALAAFLLLLMTDRFPETPLLPLLPCAALLVAAAFLLAGNGVGPNSLRDKTDELRQAILDRLFFTEPRDVFSLSSEGFYPEGQEQLGGKPNPSDHPVMQVSTPRSVYLRGVVMNDYTGRSWRNTTGGRRYLWQSSRLDQERSLLFNQDLPPESVRNSQCDSVTVSVRMLSDSASTLFVPQRVRELVPGEELVPYFSNSSELFVTRNLQAGDVYTVYAPVFQAGDPGLGTLIEVCSTFEDPGYNKAVDTYTGLPAHLEEPVYALSREVSSVAASPYDKALAIQSWLSRSFRYTLDVDNQPSDVDFVTRFLLDTREGYCTYFASAMTVLCRMAGLPARYVEGYLAEPDENGEALVTGLSAHAWTEVYFKGFGWLTFDATPKQSRSGNDHGSPEPTASPEPDESAPSPTPTPTPTPPASSSTEDEPTPEPDEPETTPSPTPEPTAAPDNPQDDPVPTPDPKAEPSEENEHGPFPWYWILLVLLILVFAGRVFLTSPSFRAKHARNARELFDIWVDELVSLLRADNWIRRKGETPMAFGRRVDASSSYSVSLGPVGECVSLISYSKAVPTDLDIGLVRDTSILLKGELGRPARLRYLFRRLFVPARRR
jgi:transglutaminase-like putative cysteine protease